MRARLHRLLHLVLDASVLFVAWYFAFVLRFDSPDPLGRLHDGVRDNAAVRVVVIKLLVMAAFGLYYRWWRHTSLRDLIDLARALVIGEAIAFAALIAFPVYYQVSYAPRVPRGVIALDLAMSLIGLVALRAGSRWLFERPRRGHALARGPQILIVGAGAAGTLIAREIEARRVGKPYEPIGFLDDDPNKQNHRFYGVKVLGPLSHIGSVLAASPPDEVLIAMPSATGAVRQRVVDACRRAQVPVRTLPGVGELLDSDNPNLLSRARAVQVEDLLGRAAVRVDLRIAGDYVRGQVVAITGAGGSIGSELCRQIARLRPARLILIDHAENNLFEIEQELIGRGIPLRAVMLDVKDTERLATVLTDERPATVFHAAAYKHVPMMEANPLEAIRNNSLATRGLADACAEAGVSRVVLISTDKAVDPQTVMGSTKALCEWVLEAAASEHPETQFVAVRFGNVLGSSGSVIPTFRRQIEQGGPVTVTDRRMTRFFMTIPEAVQLVIEAGGAGESGDVFVLDMGEPVSIWEVAERMIELSGHQPSEIEIREVGIRPGEKLDEKLFGAEEAVETTAHEKLLRARRAPIDVPWLHAQLDELQALADAQESLGAVALLREIVETPQRAGGPAGTAAR